jgi:hypothetical protein
MSNVLEALGGWNAVLLLAFASYRLARMLVSEDGPFDMFDHIRRVANRVYLGSLLSCIYCTSVWTAAILLVVWVSGIPGQVVVLILAVAGVACIPIKFEQVITQIGEGDDE